MTVDFPIAVQIAKRQLRETFGRLRKSRILYLANHKSRKSTIGVGVASGSGEERAVSRTQGQDSGEKSFRVDGGKGGGEKMLGKRLWGKVFPLLKEKNKVVSQREEKKVARGVGEKRVGKRGGGKRVGKKVLGRWRGKRGWQEGGSPEGGSAIGWRGEGEKIEEWGREWRMGGGNRLWEKDSGVKTVGKKVFG